MNMHYKTEKVLSGLPPEIGEYLHLFMYFEASECLTVAAVTAAGAIAASEIPYAGAVVSSILTAYAADIVTKNQGSGVDVEIRIPIVAATGLASYVHISTHRPADATSSYEGYFTNMRATVSGDALGPGTTPDGWERLGVDLNIGAGGKYIYFEILPPPLPQPIFTQLLAQHKKVLGQTQLGQAQPGNVQQTLPQKFSTSPLILKQWPPSSAPANFVCAVDVQVGQNAKPPVGYTQIPVDLNMGAGGAYIYASYKLGTPPLTGIAVVAGSAAQVPTPTGYTRINVDLNQGAGGKYIYLCYK